MNALKGAKNSVVDIVCNVYRMGLGESLGLIIAKTSGPTTRAFDFQSSKVAGRIQLIEVQPGLLCGSSQPLFLDVGGNYEFFVLC